MDRFGGGANAININATEKLEGGLTAGFSSQMRFHPSTGNMASNGAPATPNPPLFHIADLFISGGFGTVRMGKVNEASNCAFDPWGCVTGTGSLITGTAAYLLAATPQANSIRYITPSISGLQASFQTTLNRADEDRQVFDVTYAAGPIVAQYIRAENSAASGGLQNGETGGVKAMEHGIGLSYKLPMATLMFNHINKENAAGAKTSSVNNIGASIPVGKMAIWAGYSKDSKATDTVDTAWALGVNYPLSKRTSVGADVFEKEVLNGSTGFVLRARHSF